MTRTILAASLAALLSLPVTAQASSDLILAAAETATSEGTGHQCHEQGHGNPHHKSDDDQSGGHSGHHKTDGGHQSGDDEAYRKMHKQHHGTDGGTCGHHKGEDHANMGHHGHMADASGTITAGAFTIDGAYARASIGRAPNSAGYMTITTTGGADRLIGAESPVANAVELHTVIHQGDVMKMVPVEAIALDAAAPAELAPGGNHVMFLGLVEPLKDGSAIPLTLIFETAGRIEIMLPVKKTRRTHSH